MYSCVAYGDNILRTGFLFSRFIEECGPAVATGGARSNLKQHKKVVYVPGVQGMMMLSVGNAGNTSITSSGGNESCCIYVAPTSEMTTAANAEISGRKPKGSCLSGSAESTYTFGKGLTSDDVAYSGRRYSQNAALIQAQQGQVMIMTRETRKISLPRKKREAAEKYGGKNNVWLSVLKTHGISDSGMKTSASTDNPGSSPFADIERETHVSAETVGSDANADSQEKLNILVEPQQSSTIIKGRGEQYYSDETVNKSHVTEKLLLPTTQGWMLFQMGDSGTTIDNETDNLKSDTVTNSRGNSFGLSNPPGNIVYVDTSVFPRSGRHICIICGEVFDIESKLDLHVKTHSYLCEICGKLFLTNEQLARHRWGHKKDRPHACDICGKTFRLASRLNIHRTGVHSGVKNHVCKICGYASAFKASLKAHLMRHAQAFRFHCEVCGKGYYNKNALETHKNLHTRKRSFECNICGKAFFFKPYLIRHKRTTHLEVQDDGSPSSFKGHECQICGKVLKYKKSLLRHVSSHVGGNYTFLCDICGKAFESNSALETHGRVHTGEKPYDCDLCGKAFGSKSGLKIHLTVHTGEKRHSCDQCGKSFTQQSSLIVHKRYHTGQRPYRCHLCNKGFVTKTLFKIHQNTACV
jgi:uncharacterized Zn-finger protein